MQQAEIDEKIKIQQKEREARLSKREVFEEDFDEEEEQEQEQEGEQEEEKEESAITPHRTRRAGACRAIRDPGLQPDPDHAGKPKQIPNIDDHIEIFWDSDHTWYKGLVLEVG